MKSFKIKYSPLIWSLLTLVIVLSLCGLAWNVFSMIEFLGLNITKVISASILSVLCLALVIFSLSIVFYGKYIVKGNYLVSYFGIIKSKIDIGDITHVIHFKKSDKLVVYYGEKSFVIILVSPVFYEEFTLALREVNKSIVYDNRIEGEDTPN